MDFYQIREKFDHTDDGDLLGTDIRTVSIWEPLMQSAYVLGGDGHYGIWNQKQPNELHIWNNYEYERTQTWTKKGDEEE